MVKIALIDRPGDYRLTITGDLEKIREILTVTGVKFKSFDNLPVVSVNYPNIETIAQVVLAFSDLKPTIDKAILVMLQGEHFNSFTFPKGLPLTPYQQALIRKIFRKNYLLINDDSGTGKTHTLLGLILGSSMTVTYIAPIDVQFQIKRILSRYYKDEVYDLAMKKINFLPLTKTLSNAPEADILIIDEVHRVVSKKELIKSISKKNYKIRILMTPKSKMSKQDKKVILKLFGLKLENNPDRILEEYSHYGQQCVHPQVKPIVVPATQAAMLEIKKRFLFNPDREHFERFRKGLIMERYHGLKPFIKKKLIEEVSIAIIVSSEEIKKAIENDFPMFKRFELGVDHKHIIFDPENSPDGIELENQEIISLESYSAGSLAADFVYRFYRKALGEQRQSFFSVKTDHPFDKFFIESQAFSSVKNQLQYLSEKLATFTKN